MVPTQQTKAWNSIHTMPTTLFTNARADRRIVPPLLITYLSRFLHCFSDSTTTDCTIILELGKVPTLLLTFHYNIGCLTLNKWKIYQHAIQDVHKSSKQKFKKCLWCLFNISLVWSKPEVKSKKVYANCKLRTNL